MHIIEQLSLYRKKYLDFANKYIFNGHNYLDIG